MFGIWLAFFVCNQVMIQSSSDIDWISPGTVCALNKQNVFLRWEYKLNNNKTIKAFMFCSNHYGYKPYGCERSIVYKSLIEGKTSILDKKYQHRIQINSSSKNIDMLIYNVSTFDSAVYSLWFKGALDESRLNADCQLRIVRSISNVMISINGETILHPLHRHVLMENKVYLVTIQYKGVTDGNLETVRFLADQKRVHTEHCSSPCQFPWSFSSGIHTIGINISNCASAVSIQRLIEVQRPKEKKPNQNDVLVLVVASLCLLLYLPCVISLLFFSKARGRQVLRDTEERTKYMAEYKNRDKSIVKCIDSWKRDGEEQHFGRPYCTIVDSDRDKMFVTDVEQHKVHMFTMSGVFIKSFGGEGPGVGQLRFPKGICVNSKHELIVSDAGHNRCVIFTQDGIYKGKFGQNGSEQEKLHANVDVTADEIIVSDTGNSRCVVSTQDGKCTCEFKQDDSQPKILHGNIDVTADDKNNTYVISRADYCIKKYDADGSYNKSFGSRGEEKGQFRRPWYIKWYDNDLIILDDLNGLQVWREGGTFKCYIGKENSERLNVPFCATIDKHGNIVVLDDVTGSMSFCFKVYRRNGNFIGAFSVLPSVEHELCDCTDFFLVYTPNNLILSHHGQKALIFM